MLEAASEIALSVNSHRCAGCEAAGNAVVLKFSGNHEINIFTIRVSAVKALQVGAIELNYVLLAVAGEPTRDSRRTFRCDVARNPLVEGVRSCRRRQDDDDFALSVAKIERVRRGRLND